MIFVRKITALCKERRKEGIEASSFQAQATQLHTQWIPETIYLAKKLPGGIADQPTAFSAEVTTAWSCLYLHSHTHGLS